ncbi:MAG TPA: A/G-specific adenine glycosylase [Polyangiaceae bacterium]|nr:A/G-specific adenine glycosylase [Polyangiaceae bacterium]
MKHSSTEEKPRPSAARTHGGPGPVPDFETRLLAWYDRNRRELPWRDTHDPYAVWVSEVMLQQTQVATVLRYFGSWMRRFPTVRALARAPEADVLHAWQGLGYYSRARRLHEGARVVVERHAGELPRAHAELLALPGIGAYSAGAIASIAFGAREPLVDGNVIRVLARRFGLRGDPNKLPLKRALWRLAGELVPARRPGDFNQALMELGATVCTPRAPKCDACPLRAACVARRDGLVERLPELPPRAKATRVRVAAALVRDGDAVHVVRLAPEAPRWAGLWTFPHAEVGAGETPAAAARRAARDALGVDVRVGERVARLVHTITRFRIELECYEAAPAPDAKRERRAARKTAPLRARVRPGELEELAMPAPHRKLARLVFAADRPRAPREKSRP